MLVSTAKEKRESAMKEMLVSAMKEMLVSAAKEKSESVAKEMLVSAVKEKPDSAAKEMLVRFCTKKARVIWGGRGLAVDVGKRAAGEKGGGGVVGKAGMTVVPEGLERSRCSIDNIDVTQTLTQPLPNGIPTYTVHVANTCLPGTGCGDPDGSIFDVHLHCGWFSSARQLNPSVFRRLGHDDCLVNDGCPIPAGGVISFQYAQTYPYQLSVSSVSCTCSS
ncbi:hypothetical protein Taro_037618 [Colocasia esculenta]|uniref:Uncharacterized protein n=1 Tax=Colocasia esculenta TaxID=4460 RepID=A0A843WBK8_COLES|nr:hypothetical protein [Colocasia esculenta]